MDPVLILNSDVGQPCHAIALYQDGTVRVSGLHCAKGTHVGTYDATTGAAGLTATAFAGKCDPALVPDARTLAGMADLMHAAAPDALVTDAFVPGQTYVEAWACPCAERAAVAAEVAQAANVVTE